MAPLVGQMGRCSVQREQRVKRREVRRGLGKGGDKSLTWELGTSASVKTGRSFLGTSVMCDPNISIFYRSDELPI